MVAKVQVQAREQQIFGGQVVMKFVNAEMDPERAAMLAHKALTKSDVFDPRELRLELIRRIEATVRHFGNDALAADGDRLRAILDVILATHPKLLFDAQKAAIAEHFVIEDADEEIPESLESDDPLVTSRLNEYGALPAGLNGWEKDFAGVLDADS